MKLSRHITLLTDDGDDGWGLFYKARALKDAGHPIVELTIGEHDIRTDPSILSAMHRAATGGHTGYAIVPGTDTLRDTVAARIAQRTGQHTTRDNVLITPGGQAALFAAHVAVLDPGANGAFIDPYYATYPGTIRGAGGVAKSIITQAEQAFQPTRAALDAGLPGCASLLINSPNNPTGVVYSPATLDTIAAACQDHDVCLISDEVYDTQVWSGTHISPRSLPGMAERTLVVGSMSKSHAMTGSRVGWLVGPAEAIAALIDLATVTNYGVPGYIQDASVFALEQGQDLEAKIAAPFRRRRDLAQSLIARQNAVRALPADGAMYLMLDIRATGLSGKAFAGALLDAHQIAVMPGESFGAAAAGHIRIAMTIDDTAFRTALQTILTFAQSQITHKARMHHAR
ncbi:pyridoxal phosphate-dependent aminotransferase [Actibacterium sp. 188UL27-1]|uniref:pyridoxal phosphate-dependent aminotransferase n=1 Tax=Actibacterium sp. 188UL27-1 TaxID=2786961 RepID=UPI00195A3099|nr:pyridoxal phosphate-dependent aminotransferase [Actibacterium sp. 188UL27-1]MBM7067321.1 pyridoxal phosphate-dependent aminotransferase [Actibacterium sp. 188UL27-1]